MNWNVFARVMRRTVVAGQILSFAFAVGSVFADDNFGSPLASLDKASTDKTSTDANSASPPAAASPGKSYNKKSTRDPVAAAMALPKGKILSKQQQEAYDKLKANQGEDLRQALDDVAQAKTQAEKNKALKAIRDARLAIRAGMAAILAMPAGGDSQSGSGSSSSSYASSGSNGTGNYSSGTYANGSNYGSAPYGGYYPAGGYTTGGGGGGTSTGGGSMSGGSCQPSGGSGGGRSHR